jgi:AcrR family transcriptional regulator
VTQPAEQRDARQALLDAAERLLVEVGYAGITTRRLAHEAGVNHGLVHYYFGSMENLLASVLDRFTASLIERQKELYAGDAPFIEKWRTAMSLMDVDRASGYQKIWLELLALAWNNPELRERVANVTAEWRAVLHGALEDAATEYGRDPSSVPVVALTALIETFTIGAMAERHAGVDQGQRELLDAVEAWLVTLEEGKEDARPSAGRRRTRRP